MSNLPLQWLEQGQSLLSCRDLSPQWLQR